MSFSWSWTSHRCASSGFETWQVAERCNTWTFDQVTDTVAVRSRIGECFELAALPGTSDEDRAQLLHFVVVGGGPTGEGHAPMGHASAGHCLWGMYHKQDAT